MKYYTDLEVTKMNKEDLQKALLELQAEYENLDNDYDRLDESYGELENENCDMADRIEELESQLEYNNDLVDMKYLKEKLRLYDFYSEKLWNFLDDYMRLYNK